MLIVTGVFIGFVLVVMVGQTARTMQGTGWMPITPIDVTLPYWPGPVVRRLSRRSRRSARRSPPRSFVIGSYFLAQEMKVKRPQRRARRRRPAAARPELAAEHPTDTPTSRLGRRDAAAP